MLETYKFIGAKNIKAPDETYVVRSFHYKYFDDLPSGHAPGLVTPRQQDRFFDSFWPKARDPVR